MGAGEAAAGAVAGERGAGIPDRHPAHGEKELAKLTPAVRRRVAKKIDALASNPRPAGVKALTGLVDALRLRVGDHRVLHRVHDDVVEVVVIAVGHRREVYRQR